MINESCKILWEEFKNATSLSANQMMYGDEYDAWYFGDGSELTDELAALVCKGKKTATSSDYWAYLEENEVHEIPKIGSYAIILSKKLEAVAIIKMTALELFAFEDVPERIALLEGEDDKSLSVWREAHAKFFFAEKPYDKDRMVLCQTFELVYRAKHWQELLDFAK